MEGDHDTASAAVVLLVEVVGGACLGAAVVGEGSVDDAGSSALVDVEVRLVFFGFFFDLVDGFALGCFFKVFENLAFESVVFHFLEAGVGGVDIEAGCSKFFFAWGLIVLRVKV